MIKFGGVSTFHRYFCDPYSKILFSTSGEEVSDLNHLVEQGIPLSEAISHVAHKYYGEELCA